MPPLRLIKVYYKKVKFSIILKIIDVIFIFDIMIVEKRADNMNDEQIKDSRIEMELSNPVYDIVEEAIFYNMKKYTYKEYDIVKLVMMIYKGDYTFITNDKDYREQVTLLDEYFRKEYNHSIITLEMIKSIINLKGEEYDNVTAEIAYIENILRTSDAKSEKDLSVFSYPIKNKKYDDLMYFIEKNISMKYAVAIMYDKIKFEKFNEIDNK